jgi:cobalt-zinc-cadmium efflux system membrane fusion protein
MKIRTIASLLGLLIGLLIAGCNKGGKGESSDGGSPKAEVAEKSGETGKPASATPAAAEKCPHNAAKEDCFICDPSKREKGRLWCKEHNRYEDRCFLCHPELKEEKRLYCEEHGLYEDECFLCHPELKTSSAPGITDPDGKGGSAVAENAIKTGSTLLCKEHNVSEQECGICHPDLLKALEVGRGMKIRFSSTSSASKSGVETGKAQEEMGASGPAFLSRVTYNQNKFAHITSLAPGVVQRVLVDFGSQVKKGQVLVEVASPDIAQAKAEYLGALSELHLKETVFKREKGLAEKQVSSKQESDQAEAEYRKSKTDAATFRQRLLSYGFGEEEVASLAKNPATSATLQIRAPFAGTIVERRAVIGEAISPDRPLFQLADLSTMWLELSIPGDAFASVRVGDPVAASFDALSGVQLPGKLIWISSAVDGTSRMLKARAEIQNPGALLKDGLFGKARLPMASPGKRMDLPAGAAQRIDGENVVFVKLAEDLYEIRKVWMEETDNGRVSILEGITPEDEVVLAGSFTMKSEFLKSRLGAGCTDD